MLEENNINENDKKQVESGFEEAKQFVQETDLAQLQNGEWFSKLLIKVLRTYKANVRAAYFQQKYPGLSPDEIADKLISVNVNYAMIAGGIAGVAASANQVALVGTAGMSAALFAGSIGIEMIYLANLQMKLVLDLAVIYDLQLDLDDPEDALMVFGYALGVTPTELVGKGVQVAAGAGTKTLIKEYISKGTLKAIQDIGRQLGFKILQRTILKYAVPGVSALVGSSYNRVTTRRLGAIAKAHFKNRGEVTEELRILITRQKTYELVYPAAVMYVAKVDGEYEENEKRLYESMLTRMKFEPHIQEQFLKLIKSEQNILEAIADISDPDAKEVLMELLIMMVVSDGEFAEQERDFLEKTAGVLGLTLDTALIEKRADEQKAVFKSETWRESIGKKGQSLGNGAKQIGQSLGNTTSNVGQSVKGLFSRKQKRMEENFE